MSTISKKVSGFIFNGSALNLATATFKSNLNIIYGFNSAGTGYVSFKPTSNFNSLTQLVQDGVYIVDAATLGFDLPGAVLALGAVVAPTLGKAQVFIDGDSLDYGQATSDPKTKSWSAQLYAQLDQTKFGQPILAAVSGQSVADMLTRQQQYVLDKIDTVNYQQVIVSIGGGHNDLMGGTATATIKANWKQYIQNLRAWSAAHGNFPVKVILQSLTPNGKQYGSITLQEYETRRKQLNDEAFVGYSSVYGADYYQNYNSDAHLLDVNNTTYYDADKQHFTDAGQAWRALDNKPVLLAAQAGTALAPLPAAATSTSTRLFRADVGVTLTSNAVSWADQAGSGDVATTANVSGVQLLTAAVNGHAALRLTSTALTGSVAAGLSGAAPFQFLAVVRLPSADNRSIMGFGGDPGQPGAIADMISYDGKLCLHTLNGAGGDSLNTFSAPAMPTGTFCLAGVRHDGTKAYSYTNVSGLSAAQDITHSALPDSPIRLGGGHYDNLAGKDLHDGVIDIAEVRTFNGFDNAQWATDVAELKARYALA